MPDAAYSDTYDVAIVGGGPAGLTAAIWLGRYLRRVVLIDAGDPRNWESRRVHGYLGLEGITPGELRGRGRDDARRFGATLVDATVSRVDRVDDDRSPGNEARALELGGGMSLDCDQIFFTTRYCQKGAGCSTSIVCQLRLVASRLTATS